jgi:UDP-glucose 4-epimerase
MAAGRILITGATGFVGRHIVQALLDRSFCLTLAVRNLGTCPSDWRQNGGVNIVGDVDLASADLSPRVLELAFKDVRTVVHLAGLAHVATSDNADGRDQFMQVNAEATRQLVEVAHSNKIDSFIHLSSLAAITANAREAIVDDKTADEPVTPYGRSKRAAERHLRILSETGAFAVSLRPPLIIGAEAKGNWALLQALANTGLPLPLASVTAKRSFVSVQSTAEAIVKLCSSNWASDMSGEYCLADPEPLSLPDVLTALRHGMGHPSRLFPFPPRAFAVLGALTGRRRQLAGLIGSLRVDPSHFYSTFAFAPTLPLKEAIRQSGAAYSAARQARQSRSSDAKT